jgi:glycosyltransferase involved in cell wall biosynthesis
MAAPPICLLVDGFPVLSETFVGAEARELARLGHAIRIETATGGDGVMHPGDPDVFRREDDSPEDRRAAMRWLLLRHPLRCLADRLRRGRWRREEWAPPLGELAPVARRIAEAGERHLHAHFAAGSALTALRLSRLLRLTYSVTAHGYDVFLSPANLREKLERAAVAFTVCEYNAEHLRELAPDARIEVVVMGVDPAVFRRAGEHPGGRTVLGVGRLVEKKGFGVLAQAARKLTDARVVIAGEGPLREELGGAPVELAGAVDPARVRSLMESADVLAMPCVVAADGDRDSMPVVVKEAMAMELMVVATDEVGLPECVRKPWGRLVAPGDADALAAALGEVLALSPEDRAKAGAAAREWGLAHADGRTETRKVSDAIVGLAS